MGKPRRVAPASEYLIPLRIDRLCTTAGVAYSAAISHDILEFSARVLTQWAVSFPNALDA